MNNIVLWVLRIAAAGILLQTLYFKFTGAPESVHIFTTLGAEPWGRIGSGVVELIAAVLILYPATTGIGAVLALGVMSGAILSHLTILGIESQGDGGTLFFLAVIVFLCSMVLAWHYRKTLPVVGAWF
ncbi:MAG: DoxX family protein [Saprospiraceae bacterium]|nr:DoxX family protein [Saprospiraceae bacterium]